MTHQDVGDADLLPDLLDQLLPGRSVEVVGGDGAYDTKSCHAAIAATDAQPSIPPREGAMRWPEAALGAAWRNAAIDAIATSSRHEWKKASGYHRRSLVENLMYRLKTLTGHSLWARTSGSQATEAAIRACSTAWFTGVAPPSNSIYATRLCEVTCGHPDQAYPLLTRLRELRPCNRRPRGEIEVLELQFTAHQD